MPDDDRQLRELVAFPREDLSIEIKGWLDLTNEADRANAAKAMLALANSGGGYLVFGFRETQGQWEPTPYPPDIAKTYSQDAINDIVRRYADPAFQCALHHVSSPDGQASHPVVIVPGNQRVPIRAKRDDPTCKHVRVHAYYIRRPGPSSDTPQTAQEWDDLIRRCMLAARDDLLTAFRHIMDPSITPSTRLQDGVTEWERSCRKRWDHLVATHLADEEPSRYEHGTWSMTYALSGAIRTPDLRELLAILSQVSGHETGWPPWWVPTRRETAPYPFQDHIECWMKETKFDNGAHSDFWCAAPDAKLYLLRGYQEDAEGDFTPGTVLVATSPLWTTAEVLLHAQRLANVLATGPANVHLRCRWEGLTDRTLASWRRTAGVPTHRCRQEAVEAQLSCTTEQITDALPELVIQATKPLFQAFEFFTPTSQFVQREMAELQKSRV